MDIISNTAWGMQIRTPLEPLNLSRVDAIALHHMAHPTADIYEVQRWHLNQGWRAFGYNYWVGFDGTIYEGRGLHMGAGVANQNDHIISIGFQGNYQSGIGLDVNVMSAAQFNAGVDIINWVQKQVPTAARIGGHSEFMATACPGDTFPLDEMKALQKRKEESTVPLTVQTLSEVYVQTIDNPLSLGFYVFDCPKRSVWVGNYFNAGFFAQNADGSTIPVGNLADCGNIISQSKDNADWINVAKKKLTTIYTTNAGGCGMVQTDDLATIPDLRAAISGIPIARGGQQVSMDEIKAEGYDGSELYDTWHGFLGLRENYLVYAAAKCDYWQMFWILRALGVKDAVKLDGGGSFILHNGYEIAGTSEECRINNCGMWEG